MKRIHTEAHILELMYQLEQLKSNDENSPA